jgi:hypothetical protein
MRCSLRRTPEPDLLAELDERLNAVARLDADLADGDFTDGDERQLRGGIAFEGHHVEMIVAELEARQRAYAHGYQPSSLPAEVDLPGRFAAAKLIDTADVVRALTRQPGVRSGARSRFTCPFHAGGHERTPSLTVFPDGLFHCFGCGAHGSDAVAFVSAVKSIGMVEALRLLEAGVLGVGVA